MRLVFGILFFGIAFVSYGQYPYYGSPYYGGGYYGSTIPNTVFKNQRITVITKTDSAISFVGMLEAGFNLVTVGKQGKRYTPQTTKEIVLSNFKGQGDMHGFSTDSTWMFRVVDGKINMYSRVPLFGDKQATHIQKGNDGPIVQLTMANLQQMIPEEERDLKLVDLFDNYKLQSIVKYYNKLEKK